MRKTVWIVPTIMPMVGFAARAEDGGRPLRTTLTGAAEVPGPG